MHSRVKNTSLLLFGRQLRLTMAVFCLVCSQSTVYASSFSGDSSGVSTIAFEKMEATLSSRIIHFRWSVESETNGAYFLIEKSLDEEAWTNVTRVQSLKNHNEQHTYEISEINFAEGVHEYFRVMRVDEFGDSTELDRVNINRPVLTNMLLIPTPRKVNKETTVSYDSMICARGTLRITSQSGDIVFEKFIDISEGYNRYLIPIKSFEKGDYLVVVKDEFENKISKRLVVYK